MFLVFRYTNHRNIEQLRKIRFVQAWIGQSPFHEGCHCFVRGFCLDRNEYRDFLLTGMLEIREEMEPGEFKLGEKGEI